MTATLTEHPDTRGSVSVPTLTFDDLEDGIDLITRLVADDDAAHARLHLDIADRVRAVHDSDHPDLQALDAAGLTITGKPAKRIRAALELVAYDYADALSLDPKIALDRVWEHFHAGTTHRALWQAVADRRITARQAGTIRGQAQRLDKRTAVVTVRRWAPAPVLDPDGNLIDVHLSEGDPLFPGQTLQPAVDAYLDQAITWAADDGHTDQALYGRCSRLIARMTPGYELLKVTRRDDTRELVIEPCEDEIHDHVTVIVPREVSTRLRAFAHAAADATADAERAAGIHDPRTHSERANDAVVDLLQHAMNGHTPALSDSHVTADEEAAPARGRTHRPASSTQVHVRIDAATLFGLDEDEGWVDGLGPVPAHVARELAADPDARWRKIITAPGTGEVLDVAREAYRPSEALRRLITTRDRFCRGPGCRVPAIDCDLDHVIPWPQGPTTPENLRALCRTHHRFKTQYAWETERGRRHRLAARHAALTPAVKPEDDPPPF